MPDPTYDFSMLDNGPNPQQEAPKELDFSMFDEPGKNQPEAAPNTARSILADGLFQSSGGESEPPITGSQTYLSRLLEKREKRKRDTPKDQIKRAKTNAEIDAELEISKSQVIKDVSASIRDSYALEIENKRDNIQKDIDEEKISLEDANKNLNSFIKTIEGKMNNEILSNLQVKEEVDRINKETGENLKERVFEITKNNPQKETPFFEGAFGAALRSMDEVSPFGLGDFIDDMGRALSAGQQQARTVEETIPILTSGKQATPEEVQNMIEATKKMEQASPSDEMVNYQEVYEENKEKGKPVFGVMKGLYENPSVAPEVFLSSMSAMFNKASATSAGGIAAAGTAYGAGTGALAAGVGAAPGAVGGLMASLPYAVSAAGVTLEASLSFNEFLKEELGDKEFTEENVRVILEDEEKLDRIRTRSLKRGATIGVIDALTARLAVGVSSRLLRKGTSKLTNLGVTSGVEALGGSSGEAAARVVAGQELDASDIILEGVGETVSAPVDIISAIAKKGKYKVNGEVVSKETAADLIEKSNPIDLDGTNVEIEGDDHLTHLLEEKKKDAQILSNIDEGIQGEDREKIFKLEKERIKIEEKKIKLRSDKKRLEDINNQIDSISDSSTPDIEEKEKSTSKTNTSEKGRLHKFTTSTDEKYGYIEENGKQRDLTKAEYEAIEKEEGLFDIEGKAVVEETPTDETTDETTEEAPAVTEEEGISEAEPVGVGKKIRGFAESAADKVTGTTAKERIKKNNKNYYEPQKWDQIKDKFDDMTEEQLLAEMNTGAVEALHKEGNDNMSILAGVEAINRRIEKGESIDDLVEKYAKEGTRLGQLVAQFAALNNSTPYGILRAVEKTAQKQGNILSAEQKKKIQDLGAEYLTTSRKLKSHLESKSGNASDSDIETMKTLEKEATTSLNDLTGYLSGFTDIRMADMMSMTVQGNLLTPMSQAVNIAANVAQQGVRLTMAPIEQLTDAIQSIFTGKRKGSFDPKKYAYGFLGSVKGLKDAFKGILKGQDTYAKGEINRAFRPVTAWAQALSDTKLGTLIGVESGLLPKKLSEEGAKLMEEAELELSKGNKDKAAELMDKAFDKSGVNWKTRAKKIYEGTFGVAPEVMFRLLALGDKPFYEGVKWRTLYESGKRKGLKGKELHNFVMMPDSKSLEEAHEEGLVATFQEDSEIAKGASLITNTIANIGGDTAHGDVIRFIFKTAVPYVKTPSNILSQTIDLAVPGVSLAKSALYYAKGDARKGGRYAATAAVGVMLSKAAEVLIMNGLVSSPFQWGEDEQDDLQAKKGVEFPPNSLNLSGLERLLDGGSPDLQENDRTVNLQKLGLPGAILLIRSSQNKATYEQIKSAESFGKEYEPSVWDQVNDLGLAVGPALQYTLEQSFLAGTSAVLEALKGGESETRKWQKGFFRAASTIVAPNTLASIDRALDTYYQDMGTQSTTEMMEGVFRERFGFLIEEGGSFDELTGGNFPIKHNIWGEPITTTPEGKDPFVHQFLDISQSRKVPEDALSLEVYNLYRNTLDPAVVPNLPRLAVKDNEGVYRRVEKNKQTLTAYNEYVKVLGSVRRMAAEKIIKTSSYKKATLAQKVKKLEKMYALANKNSKALRAKRDYEKALKEYVLNVKYE